VVGCVSTVGGQNRSAVGVQCTSAVVGVKCTCAVYEYGKGRKRKREAARQGQSMEGAGLRRHVAPGGDGRTTPFGGAAPPLRGGGWGRRRGGGVAGGGAGSWRSPCQGRSRSHIGGLQLLASAVTRGCLVGEGKLNKELIPPKKRSFASKNATA
jgi:hypothetical protein